MLNQPATRQPLFPSLLPAGPATPGGRAKASSPGVSLPPVATPGGDAPFLTLPRLRPRTATPPPTPPSGRATLSPAAAPGAEPLATTSPPAAPIPIDPPHFCEAQMGGGTIADGGGVFSQILTAIIAERRRQAETFGHTAPADDARDLFAFSKGAGRLLHSMNEVASLHRLDQTRRAAIKLAAYSVALAESCQRRIAALDRGQP